MELATIAETNSGTDATRAVTPDGLEGWTGDANITTVGTIGTGTWQGTVVAEAFLPNASATAQGVSELATSAEINTGSDTGRTVTPDGLENSQYNIMTASPDYTLNATVVIDRTLLASASATTLNNNNVLAGILTDLIAKNVFG